MIYNLLLLELQMKNKDIANQYEDDNNDYIDINDVIIPNHYVGMKDREKSDLK